MKPDMNRMQAAQREAVRVVDASRRRRAQRIAEHARSVGLSAAALVLLSDDECRALCVRAGVADASFATIGVAVDMLQAEQEAEERLHR